MTKLPATAPSAYARSQFGPKVAAWMRAKGFIDSRYVQRLEPAPKPLIEVVS